MIAKACIVTRQWHSSYDPNQFKWEGHHRVLVPKGVDHTDADAQAVRLADHLAVCPEDEERMKVPRITRRIRVTGDLDEKQVERLHYIANRCPVHRVVTENPYIVDDLALGE